MFWANRFFSAGLTIRPLYWGQLFYHNFGKTFGSLLVSDFASLYRAPEDFMVYRRGEPDIQHELLSSYVQVVSTYMRYLSYFINCYYQGRVKSSHQGKIASVCWKKRKVKVILTFEADVFRIGLISILSHLKTPFWSWYKFERGFMVT